MCDTCLRAGAGFGWQHSRLLFPCSGQSKHPLKACLPCSETLKTMSDSKLLTDAKQPTFHETHTYTHRQAQEHHVCYIHSCKLAKRGLCGEVGFSEEPCIHPSECLLASGGRKPAEETGQAPPSQKRCSHSTEVWRTQSQDGLSKPVHLVSQSAIPTSILVSLLQTEPFCLEGTLGGTGTTFFCGSALRVLTCVNQLSSSQTSAHQFQLLDSSTLVLAPRFQLLIIHWQSSWQMDFSPMKKVKEMVTLGFFSGFGCKVEEEVKKKNEQKKPFG